MVLRPSLAVFMILWLSIQRCRGLDDNVFSWTEEYPNRIKTLGPNQLMECETLNISLPPEMIHPSQAGISYHVLAFEPEGKATMFLAGHEPSSLQWTIQYPAGTRLLVALLDSFGTFLGVLPAMYTVTPGSTHCLAKYKSPAVTEATQPQISSFFFGRLIPCSSCVHGYLVPSGELSGQVIEGVLCLSVRADILAYLTGFVSDTNGVFGMTSSIIDIAATQDTPFADSPGASSKCRPTQPEDLPLCLCELPRPAAFRSRRTFPNHPHMQWTRDSDTVGISHEDAIVVAVFASLGGTGVVAMAIYAIIMYRRRRKFLDAQDTLPRPFEVTVPAATTMITSMRMHNLTPASTIGIPRRICAQNRGRSGYETRGEGFAARIEPSRASSTSTPTTAAPSQSQPSSSRDISTQFHLSDTSPPPNQAGPSSYRTPLRSWIHPHTLTSPDPYPQSRSRVQTGQLSSSIPMCTRTQRTIDVLSPRSTPTREQRSAKHALWLSRSASELYSIMPSNRHCRLPEYGPHGPQFSSSRYADRHHESELHADTLRCPTNHLRQWHSGSPVVHRQRLCSDPEVGTAIIFQHQDAGVMQELPPPYHKLVRSCADVT